MLTIRITPNASVSPLAIRNSSAAEKETVKRLNDEVGQGSNGKG